MSIRVAKFKVIGADGDWTTIRRELMEVSETLKRAVNLIWRTWIAYHDQRGSARELGAWRAAYIAWRAALHEWELDLQQWKANPRKSRGPKPAKPKTVKVRWN